METTLICIGGKIHCYIAFETFAGETTSNSAKLECLRSKSVAELQDANWLELGPNGPNLGASRLIREGEIRTPRTFPPTGFENYGNIFHTLAFDWVPIIDGELIARPINELINGARGAPLPCGQLGSYIVGVVVVVGHAISLQILNRFENFFLK